MGFDWFAIGVIPKEFIVTGKLEIHGVTRTVSTVIKINKVNTDIEIKSNFRIKTSDYRIAIPKIIQSKISEIVKIELDLLLK
jgi:polyisoprenoid-binding protein YceI